MFVRKKEMAILPTRGTKTSAGYDLHAIHGGVIEAGHRMHIETGIGLGDLVKDQMMVGIMRERSGQASKFGIKLLAGVIDSDFPDAIVVILHNTGLGDARFRFKAGDKIAQIVFLPFITADNEEIDNERVGGFGSTDKEENLCMFCTKEFPTCKAKNVKYGTGKGNDNVIYCESQVEPF